MKKEILKKVSDWKSVTFLELQHIDGFRGNSSMQINPEYNHILWDGISSVAINALQELISEKKIKMQPTSNLTYLIDGGRLNLPIVKQAGKKYKKPHWFPIVFNPF